MKPPPGRSRPSNLLHRQGRRAVALFLWCGLLGGYYWYAWQHDLSPLEAVQRMLELMTGSVLGPLIYLAFYAARPLVLFPATLLTLAAGFVFGPVLGILLVVLGSNISASVAYLAGRYFGGSLLSAERMGDTLQRYAERLRRNSFESVLVMRLVYVPFDAVNYAAGFLHVRWKPFMLATILGSLPGSISFVLFGASVEGDLTVGAPSLNPWTLLASVLIVAGSLLLSRYLKRSYKAPPDAAERQTRSSNSPR
ncbi:MAG TPA: TVP38/TMEM64 family protein [Rubrobacter sp.]|nr:TVP38/TMEM64 family protein [Rubrobacter sp.]